jgi:hypothetical protein
MAAGEFFGEMPVGKYTPFCHQCYDLVNRVREYAVKEVRPKMMTLKDVPDRNRARDVAIISLYVTVQGWLQTMENLNHPFDFQAVGSGARAVFERYLDLKWFEKFPEAEWIERYHKFGEVDRYLSAEKVVEHVALHADSKIDVSVYKAFLASVDAKEPLENLVARVWGKKSNGSPAWPNHHWTGAGDLAKRAEALGIECLDAYRELYPVMSWLVHSGPTSYLGRSFDTIESQVGWGYFFTFQHARAATITAVKLLGIDSIVENFNPTMQQWWEWRGDAIDTLPAD